MKRFLAFLALCWCAFTADGGTLLIITQAPPATATVGTLTVQ